jgi:hypothetical protein
VGGRWSGIVGERVNCGERRGGEKLPRITGFCWGLLAFVVSCGRFPLFVGFWLGFAALCWHLWTDFGICGRFRGLMPVASVFGVVCWVTMTLFLVQNVR